MCADFRVDQDHPHYRAVWAGRIRFVVISAVDAAAPHGVKVKVRLVEEQVQAEQFADAGGRGVEGCSHEKA